MNSDQQALAQTCLRAAETDSMTFPEIVGTLIGAGFEGYLVDLRRGRATYYLPDGTSVDLDTHEDATTIAAAFDAYQVRAAIREAQQLAPGYSYKGFCAKVKRAGCAGYMVSFAGRRAVYFGRTAETHIEQFPQ